MGRYEAARHIPGVSGHELSYVANKHFSIVLLNEAVADLVNAHARLDISQAWGASRSTAAPCTPSTTRRSTTPWSPAPVTTHSTRSEPGATSSTCSPSACP
jgi:hypothetical protein